MRRLQAAFVIACTLPHEYLPVLTDRPGRYLPALPAPVPQVQVWRRHRWEQKKFKPRKLPENGDQSLLSAVRTKCVILALPSETQHGTNIHQLPVVIAPARS